MRTLLVTIFVGLFITLALSSPLPAPAVWVAEKALGPDHPAMSCISATERRCKAGHVMLVWALGNAKWALPEDSEHHRSLDDLIDFYSNPYRQDEWMRQFKEMDEFLNDDTRRMYRPYQNYGY